MIKNLIRRFKNYFIPGSNNDYQPLILRWKSLVFIIIIVILSEAIFLVQTFLVFRKTNFFAEVLPNVLVELANDSRRSQNLPELKISRELQEAAQKKAEDMAKKGYFAHTSPEGLLPWHWFKEANYDFSYAGENLAVNFFDSKDVNDAWLQSPSHKENIMNGSYTEIGVGTAKGTYEGKETIFVVQLFGRPKEKPTNVLAAKTDAAPKTESRQVGTRAKMRTEFSSPTENKKTDSITKTEATPKAAQKAEAAASPTSPNVVLNSVSAPPNPPSKFAHLFSMPRQTTNYVFIFILTLISLTLFLEIFTPAFSKIKIPFSSMLSHGFLIFLIIFLLILVNKYLNIVNAAIF